MPPILPAVAEKQRDTNIGTLHVLALDRVRRRDVLGGLIHEYKTAA